MVEGQKIQSSVGCFRVGGSCVFCMCGGRFINYSWINTGLLLYVSRIVLSYDNDLIHIIAVFFEEMNIEI